MKNNSEKSAIVKNLKVAFILISLIIFMLMPLIYYTPLDSRYSPNIVVKSVMTLFFYTGINKLVTASFLTTIHSEINRLIGIAIITISIIQIPLHYILMKLDMIPKDSSLW